MRNWGIFFPPPSSLSLQFRRRILITPATNLLARVGMYVYIHKRSRSPNIIFNPLQDYRVEISTDTPKIQIAYYGWMEGNINLILRVFVPGLFALITSYIFNRELFYFPGHKNCLPESRFTDRVLSRPFSPPRVEINAPALKVS